MLGMVASLVGCADDEIVMCLAASSSQASEHEKQDWGADAPAVLVLNARSLILHSKAYHHCIIVSLLSHSCIDALLYI